LEYPLAARRMREQGEARVRVLVDVQGLPQQLQLVLSSGSTRLDEAALQAARRARFKPYTENGTALPFWVVMPLVFELEK
jgi:protein TonB